MRRTAAALGAIAALAAGTALATHAERRTDDAPGVETRREAAGAVAQARADTGFAALVARLSETGGYFDTDNLISNERSYLHALDAIRRVGTTGGAFVGVGPDQSFSYIAEIRPRVAFMIDIRRDNLLQHLLFKALFAESRSRLEYLALLLGRPLPEALAARAGLSAERLVAVVDSLPVREADYESASRRVRRRLATFGVPLSEQDLATVVRFHRAFHEGGLDLQFTSFNRQPQSFYPTLRDLVLERDRSGARASYLASDERFRVVQELQRRDLVIPVVGDLAGTKALRAIGAEVKRRGLSVSALYTSNVEFYLFRSSTFGQFAENVEALPRDRRSVIVRSYFNRFSPHPQAVDGYASVQLVQRTDDFVEAWKGGRLDSYAFLVHERLLPAR